MADDQVPPADLHAETSAQAGASSQAGTPQTPVIEALPEPIATTPSEPISEPLQAASTPSEPAQPVSETTPEAVAAEPQSEREAPEPEPARLTNKNESLVDLGVLQ